MADRRRLPGIAFSYQRSMIGRMASQTVTYWLQERLRDLFRWPQLLIRYFPRRSKRLLRTLALGLKALSAVGSGRQTARPQGQTRGWFREAAGHVAHWLHGLSSELFDLLGGPELCQLVMRLGVVTSPLTTAEIAAAVSVLGPTAIPYTEVRIAEGGILKLVFRYNGNRAFCTWHTIYLSRTGPHTRKNRPLLLHELTHVYQYEQVGSRYLGEAIYVQARLGRACYEYGHAHGLQEAKRKGATLQDFNREQQAQIAQHYYAFRERGEDTSAYESFIAQLRIGKL